MHCFGPGVGSVKGATRPRTPFVGVIAAINFAPLAATSFQSAAAHCDACNSRDCNYRQTQENLSDEIKTSPLVRFLFALLYTSLNRVTERQCNYELAILAGFFRDAFFMVLFSNYAITHNYPLSVNYLRVYCALSSLPLNELDTSLLLYLYAISIALL